MNRTQEREQAFITIFEKGFSPELAVEELFETGIENGVFEDSAFSKKLATMTEENISAIDEQIEKYAIGWTLNRMKKVSVAILRIAICEVLFFDDIPNSVSVNEAVELSKKYAEKSDASFINGILGSVVSGIE
ncbi:MAG: transcription antitermination factor NusB [Clostridia bacterium]|nr:transcription antitermination factor NusB [Clostridia bacterium]